MFGMNHSYSISQEEFLKKAAAGAHIIDVRGPQEFAQGHIKGSVNIPVNLMGAQLEKFKGYAAKKQVVLLYCHSGARSKMAYGFLKRSGVADEVFDLAGGLLQWKGKLD